ncbi:histone H2B-like [Penaeus japonicus]|uniref:histone H2B-like n=1 Tax=Penaeus japonicus TaxID=27405 RepID=UPI001C70D7CB|nr:histone H2B-like [Penaeus japonicus]
MSKEVQKQAEDLGRKIDEKMDAAKEKLEVKAKEAELIDLLKPIKPLAKKVLELLPSSTKDDEESPGVSSFELEQHESVSFLRPAVLRRRKRIESYRLYISRIVKDIEPNFGITRQGLNVMDNVTCDLFEELGRIAADFIKVGKRVTLSDRDVEAAIKLTISRDLRSDCIRQARAAVKRFKENQ